MRTALQIVEHPELLYRMEYYPNATMIDELPIEIQNMMVRVQMLLLDALKCHMHDTAQQSGECCACYLDNCGCVPLSH